MASPPSPCEPPACRPTHEPLHPAERKGVWVGKWGGAALGRIGRAHTRAAEMEAETEAERREANAQRATRQKLYVTVAGSA
eukprot:596031-Rhodomonas_salina.2